MSNSIKLKELHDFQPLAGLSAKVVHSRQQTIAFWEIEEGTILPEHHHIHEQITTVTAGELELTVDGTTTVLTPGEVVIIPSNAIHSAFAKTKCSVIDTFYPVREDFKNNTL